MDYSIIDVDSWTIESAEAAGKKAKIWILDPTGTDLWLFRSPREPGEAWAEKIAEMVAERLGIPHARYELASMQGVVGAMTRDFTGRRPVQHFATVLNPLLPGNVILQGADPQYAKDTVRTKQHHLPRIFRVLAAGRNVKFVAPSALRVPGVKSAAHAFLGYLLLDVLIGNTDRHHENWGVQIDSIASDQLRLVLAPSYDHASSLGRNLSDAERLRWLTMHDGMDRFCWRGKSKFFTPKGEVLRVRDTFPVACSLQPGAGLIWQRHLASFSAQDLLDTVDRVPNHLMSTSAKQFCRSMLDCNRNYLLSLNLP